ncbi:MAG: zinc-ribbon domain-containing protein [Candidatus Helarchaeota archaeon]
MVIENLIPSIIAVSFSVIIYFILYAAAKNWSDYVRDHEIREVRFGSGIANRVRTYIAPRFRLDPQDRVHLRFAEFPKCFLCNKEIDKSNFVICPFCDSAFHKAEFLEQLKVKGFCPNCKHEINLWKFEEYLKQKDKSTDISYKRCVNCNKEILKGAKFCIYCGEEVYY